VWVVWYHLLVDSECLAGDAMCSFQSELLASVVIEIEIVYYHNAASGWIITGNRIHYMIHEIQ